MMSPEAKLKDLGIDISKYGATPLANYAPGVQVGNLLFMAGNGPFNPDHTYPTGKLGGEVSLEQGYQAARVVGLDMLGNIHRQLGTLDHVKRVVRAMGLVNATADFKDHAKVIDGFSDLMVQVFGDAGRPARVVVGASSLAYDLPVIVEAAFEVNEKP